MADYPSSALSPAEPVALAVWNVAGSTVPFGALILGSSSAETTYFMRAERSPGPGYVVWASVGTADSAGLRAPSPIIPGTITIQARV